LKIGKEKENINNKKQQQTKLKIEGQARIDTRPSGQTVEWNLVRMAIVIFVFIRFDETLGKIGDFF
jgi:hypothetical protein